MPTASGHFSLAYSASPARAPKKATVSAIADGSWAELWVVGTNLLHDTNVQGIVVNCRDISAQKRAEKARVDAEMRYRTLVEQLANVTYIAKLGLHGEWLYVSPQIEATLGFSPSEWMNEPGLWISRVHPEDRRLVEATEEATFSESLSAPSTGCSGVMAA